MALFGSGIASEAERRSSLAELKAHLAKRSVSMSVGQICKDSLRRWTTSSSALSAIEGTNEELQKVVNAAFVWLCTKYGPVEADKVLLGSVKIAEALPEAFACSPKSFL